MEKIIIYTKIIKTQSLLVILMTKKTGECTSFLLALQQYQQSYERRREDRWLKEEV